MGLKIGKYEFTRKDIKPFIQTMFIISAILLSWVIGRYSMVYEIRTILDFSCSYAPEFMEIDEKTGTIRIRDPYDRPDWPLFNETNTTLPVVTPK